MKKVSRVSQIQSELSQKHPFPNVYQEAAVALLRTADVVRRRVAAVIEPHGITVQQYNVMRILRGAGSEGIPTLEIARRMIEQTPGITRLLDRLEDKGLVRRQRCPSDRRQVLCWITDKGSSLIQDLDPVVNKADREAMPGLKSDQIERLVELLDLIRQE